MAKREIRWYIDRDANIGTIKEVENIWGISFPKEYVDIIVKHDGSPPEVKNDDGEWKYGSINITGWHGKNTGFRFLKYSNSDDINKTRVVATYKTFKDCLPEPKKFLPFADDGAGNIYFFDYRKNKNNPGIVFLAHERAITEEDIPEEDLDKKPLKEWLNDSLYLVCNSFSELLELISPISD